MVTKNEIEKPLSIDEAFVGEVKNIINQAQGAAVRSVNFCRVQMYWKLAGNFINFIQLRIHCVRN